MSKHIVLLGDSIFDNAIYVPRGRSVHQHVTAGLSAPETASLLAVDGAVVTSVFRQIGTIHRPTAANFAQLAG